MSGVSLMFHDYIDETTLLMTLKDKQYLCLYIENDIQEESKIEKNFKQLGSRGW